MAASGGAIRAGRIRALGLAGRAPLPSLPQVPLLVDSGFSQRFAFSGFIGLLGPARLPQAVLDRAVPAFRKVVENPDFQRRLLEIDTIPGYLGPEEFREDIARSMRDWQALVTELNLSIQG
jgi:tripartite-type tricarboxylate transporter receptor subunit TctC